MLRQYRHKTGWVERTVTDGLVVSWKDICSGIFIPLMASFPWIVEILVAPVPAIQFIFLPYDGFSFLWIGIAFCYLAYFVLRGTGRLFFNIFAYASFMAVLLAFALALLVGEEYPAYCSDVFNSYLGWGLEGCVLENFLLIFILCLFLLGFFVYTLKRVNARKTFKRESGSQPA